MPLKTKLQQLREYMTAGDYRAALRLAASWPRLGTHKADIERGWAAYTNAEFYRQIGHNPEQLVAAGITAIRERYDIPEKGNGNDE